MKHMRHFPKETRGCYYEDINTCCWLCACRMFLALFRVRLSSPTTGQKKLGTIYNFLRLILRNYSKEAKE